MSELPFPLRKIYVVRDGDRVRMVVREDGRPRDVPFHPPGQHISRARMGQVEALADEIRANGLLQPIVMHEGKVLDGRKRLAACSLAGVKPRFKEFAGDNAAAYVISANLKRRHLDESQRAMVAAKIATLRHGQRRSANCPRCRLRRRPHPL